MENDLTPALQQLAEQGRAAAAVIGLASTEQKNAALLAAASGIERASAAILAANAVELEQARAAKMSDGLLDRLRLTAERIQAMADGVRHVAALPYPVGRVWAAWPRPNGLQIQRVSIPIGVIAMVYESRPNVTADAAALCLKSGNVVVLRPARECFASAQLIAACFAEALLAVDLPPAAVSMVPSADRALVTALVQLHGLIDLVIPRGGPALQQMMVEQARVPVLQHLAGLCHVYVHRDAELAMARAVVLNAKMRRVGVCGAAETLLIDAAVAPTHLPSILQDLADAGCEIRGDATTQQLFPASLPASEADWQTEYLAPILSVRVVEDIEVAIAHINHYGSHHTDSIITQDTAAAARFLAAVDSAMVLHNASTQFADGGEFGFGAEIGIATGRLHARGPVGLEQLTTYKYQLLGDGNCRP
jgi:glutamate-5-semialdehyde dehydrogenase